MPIAQFDGRVCYWQTPPRQVCGAMQILLQLPQLLLSDEESTHMSLQTRMPQLSQVPALHQPLQH